MNISNIDNNSLDVIDELNLPPEQYKAAEKYIFGEADDEILEQLTYQDISKLSPNNALKVFDDYIKKGQSDEARRLFNILFAIGQSTCHTHIPTSVLNTAAVFAPEAAYKRAAVYSVKISFDKQEQELNSTHLDYLINISKGIENLKKAAAYQKGTENGKIILLALYFTEKYTRKLLDENQNPDNPQISIENDDLPLFEEYERLILNGFHTLLKTKTVMTHSELTMIMDAINEDNIDEQILSLADSKGLGGVLIRELLPIKILGAMSYINYPLSVKLKNVVHIFFSFTTYTLYTIDDISNLLAMNIRKLGGDYDKLFGIDSKTYIRWAANHNHITILSCQLETNQEIYLSIIDADRYGIDANRYGMDTERAVNNMYKVIEQQKPDLYQALMENKQKNGQIKGIKSLADILAGDSEYSNAAREYLLGNAPIDALYPYADKMAIRPLNGSGRDPYAIHQYFSEYEDEEMRARCLTYMQFKRVGYNICCCQDVWDANSHKIDEQNVKKLFNYLEKEELDVKYQLSTFETLYNYTRSIIDKANILNASKEVFNNYLKTHREKLINEFATGSQVIRLLALSSFALSANENKKEILAFSQDTSKVIKEELIKVLCEQRHWKDDIKTLALGKKAKDRELGVRVLMQWQNEGADYRELFRQLLEKEKSAKLMELIENALNSKSDSNNLGDDTLSADAVKALALNPTSNALLTVDDIARKSKFRYVKVAAEEALDFAASQLNITRDELADRIIPDLGFNENMERIFDYGGRS